MSADHSGDELRDEAMYGTLIACTYMDWDAFWELSKRPWTPFQGTPEALLQHAEDIAALDDVSTEDTLTRQAWNMMRSG